jgi:four helix bundle protein
MGRIERFEDIKAWQLAREVVREVYGLTMRDPFVKDFSLRDQIRGAAISAMSNIAEGFERFSSKEFIQFLIISKGSIAEVRSQLYVALDLKYVDEIEFGAIKEKCEAVSRHIWNFMMYLKKNVKARKDRE